MQPFSHLFSLHSSISVDKRHIYRLNFEVKDENNNNKAIKESESTSFYLNGYTLEFHLHTHRGGGGGQGGLNLPLPVPFNPGSRLVFFGSRPFAFFRLRNIAQCCVILPFFSRFPPPLLPPPVHLPPPFLPVSRPPVPPPHHSSNEYWRKVLSNDSHSNGQRLGFHPRTQNLEPPCACSKINST